MVDLRVLHVERGGEPSVLGKGDHWQSGGLFRVERRAGEVWVDLSELHVERGGWLDWRVFSGWGECGADPGGSCCAPASRRGGTRIGERCAGYPFQVEQITLDGSLSGHP